MFADNQFDSGAPIYTQIMNKIKLRILSGQWAAGERIPAVRELAVEFGVNPNTMQRSLSELERDGLLFSERTTGRYITRDAALIERTRRQMGEELMAAFVEQMEHMGYKTTEDILRERGSTCRVTPLFRRDARRARGGRQERVDKNEQRTRYD